jgi:DNA-binding CsgD family transcriptional regulator
MLYGRDAQRAQIGALLDGARASHSGVLVIRGEPGIGKTALLEDARDRAGDMEVLVARGVESEAELPFAGLDQLLRPALHLLDRLPTPQANALEGALGLAGRGGDDRFLISLAVLTLLAELAERRPVLCLVDDAHWLDAPSADALVFVARRLDAEAIVLLFAAREGEVRAFKAGELPSLTLPGLDEEAAAALVARDLRGELAPSVRDYLLQQGGGNALALVELPAALSSAQLAGREPLPERLPVTRGVERLFLERVRRLPQPTRRLLVLAAADDSGELAPILRAADALGIDAHALRPAEDAGLLSIRDTTLRLRHPLVRSAVYGVAPLSERRVAHLALADALDGEAEEDRRAWHRAAATLGTDPEVAAELERSASRARQRGGYGAAADALVRAADLSDDEAERSRRLLLAAEASNLAGQSVRTVTLAERAAALTRDAIMQADLAILRGAAELWHGRPADTCDMLTAAAEAVAPHDSRRTFELVGAAVEAGAIAGDGARMARASGIAAAVTPDPGDERQVFLALLARRGDLLFRWNPAEAARLVRATLGLSAGDEKPRDIVWEAIAAVLAGEYLRAQELYDAAASRARELGALGALVDVLSGQALCGLFFAYVREAAETAHEAVRLAADLGTDESAAHAVGVLAWVSAIQGREDEYRQLADRVALTASRGLALPAAAVAWARAELALAHGRWEEASVELIALSDFKPGFGHPFLALASAPDLVEVAARTGRAELGATAVARLEAWVEHTGPQHVRPLLERCLALRAATPADASHHFEETLRLYEQGGSPFDAARTELLYGEHLRRERRRSEARGHLRAALETFDDLGAAPWAERARAELRASGETARKRDPSTISQLTPQEVQIARMVADGLSNKEVAAQLFLSPRTIDSHLRNVFSKLGITSRTQLARLPLDADAPHRQALPV